MSQSIKIEPNEPQELLHTPGETRPVTAALSKIIATKTIDILEYAVAEAQKFLQDLKEVCNHESVENKDAQTQAADIDKLLAQVERNRVVIGVVGNTGAGKSSVINAILDEERLVPTNCMRACTAVVTEISWNVSTDANSRYRAEIEFISHDEWQKEVGMLLLEMTNDNGDLVRDANDPNTDAGVAWAKFSSVYPAWTRTMLSECTINRLLSDDNVSNVLGTTKMISDSSAAAFYNELQKFVDSKEKISKKGKEVRQMEFWPLIKVVRIYTKAAALSTGCVLVDLPGVHDTNVARAAVAEGYMKQCTGIWVVAPIARAVDDQAAHTLIGNSFKRQLKFDGGFSNVTFICSKTDDISVTEAIGTLELHDEVEEFMVEERECNQEIKDNREWVENLQEKEDSLEDAEKNVNKERNMWKNLRLKIEEGNTVYAPVSAGDKRKNEPMQDSSIEKRLKITDYMFLDALSVTEYEYSRQGCESVSDDVATPPMPLILEDVKAKLEDLKKTRKSIVCQKNEISDQKRIFRQRTRDCKTILQTIQNEISRICISGRNDYARLAIQRDFAAGIKELDQEIAIEEDIWKFDPSEEYRDYDEIGRALPVFCVSARAYQKLCGHYEIDADVAGFKTQEGTEIPQLQKHCREIALCPQIQSACAFLSNVSRQLITLSLWAKRDEPDIIITHEDRVKQANHLDEALKELEQALTDTVSACVDGMKRGLSSRIFNKYPELVKKAIGEASDTTEKWGAPKAVGGLSWSTYRAVVRRGGAFKSPTVGFRDFNADLVEPIVKRLTKGWASAFQNKFPQAFATLTESCNKILQTFHHDVEGRLESDDLNTSGLGVLQTQIDAHKQQFSDLQQALLATMTEHQRQANREFGPIIEDAMQPAYQACKTASGIGSFGLMKEAMLKHVNEHKETMFDHATNLVGKYLETMCEALKGLMEEKVKEIHAMIKTDYERVLGAGKSEDEAKQNLVLRSEMMDMLNTVNARFEPILLGEGSFEVDKFQAGESMSTFGIHRSADVF